MSLAGPHADLDAHPRAEYREARRRGGRGVATRAYAVHDEARYLVADNVPALLGLADQVRAVFEQHGRVDDARPLDEIETPEGTEAYCITYKDIADAR